MAQDIAIYRTVIAAIQEFGGITANNWIETADMMGKFPDDELWWQGICEDAQEAIIDVDAVIVESSGVSTLGVGYELAQALTLKRPVLALVKDGDANAYVRGINHPSLQVVLYTPENIAKIVGKFLHEVSNE